PRASSAASSPASSSGGGSVGGGADSLNWGALAACESGGDPGIVSSSGKYHGLYQFSVSTWRAVGGSGLPSQASASEQTYRAKLLYQRAGAGQWPVCGKRL
ncbi:transglycosylase family protein, partial [Kineococcus indalonis]|uniref:transglycosylase family protein n=1 Tax=Kineococcus indalonis TaxID=2696566 RepID=UPI00196B05E2